MLEGFVPFPPDFASRYREKGYWQDRSLRDQFAENVFAPFADRIAVLDAGRLVADGHPAEILTSKLIARHWGVDARTEVDSEGAVTVTVRRRPA